MMEVVRTDDFVKWLKRLKDKQGKLRILERIDRLAHGNPGDVKSVGNGVSELRLAYGPGYRVYYLQDRELLVLLLCGGDKSTQQRDIEKARKIAKEWWSEEDDDDDEG
jgi:putative addiction module killer protein